MAGSGWNGRGQGVTEVFGFNLQQNKRSHRVKNDKRPAQIGGRPSLAAGPLTCPQPPVAGTSKRSPRHPKERKRQVLVKWNEWRQQAWMPHFLTFETQTAQCVELVSSLMSARSQKERGTGWNTRKGKQEGLSRNCD